MNKKAGCSMKTEGVMNESKPETTAEPWQTCGILSCDMEAQCKQPDDCKSTGKSQTTKAPSGHMRIVETRLEESHRFAVYVTIVFEDALGQRWTMDASAFRFDLEREAETVKDDSHG